MKNVVKILGIKSCNCFIFLDLSFKQNVNNVSSMTNKIELLTNSLSDPDFIGSVNGMYSFLCTFYDRF